MRGFRDRDFLRTVEGLLFCVVGGTHPKDRVIAYLKYVPDERGRWAGEGVRYRRALRAYTIPDLVETLRIVEREHPEYIYYSRVFNTRMTAVPRSRISRHYIPERRLSDILRRGVRDPLERRVAELASLLEDFGVPVEHLGVTGSILLGIHQPFSDIDMTVYGLEGGHAAMEALREAYGRRGLGVERLKGEALVEWCRNRAERHPLTMEEAKRIYERKWNIGVFRGVRFSIHPVRLEWESEVYGSRIYKPEGVVTIRGTVVDAGESIFLPAVYELGDVEVLEGPEVDDIREACSYESLYDNLAVEGEAIEVKGKLERVTDLDEGVEYHRVLVGSLQGMGGEYMKPISPR